MYYSYHFKRVKARYVPEYDKLHLKLWWLVLRGELEFIADYQARYT